SCFSNGAHPPDQRAMMPARASQVELCAGQSCARERCRRQVMRGIVWADFTAFFAAKPTRQGERTMIEGFYWPTPNGKKITIQLEGRPHKKKIPSGKYPRGQQFPKRLPPHNSKPATPRHCRSCTRRWWASHQCVRVGCDHDVPGRKDGAFLAAGHPGQKRSLTV